MAHPATQRRKELSLVQQLALGLDHLQTRLTPLPEPFSDCILLMSVSTPGEPAATFYVRRPTLAAAWRAGTTQVRQWAWSRNLDSLELRVDWPLEISAVEGITDTACRRLPASAWAVADESLESVRLLAPQAWLPAASAPTASDASLPQPRPHWLLQLQGVFVDSDGSLASLPRSSDAAAPPALAEAEHTQASLLVLQALAQPATLSVEGGSEQLQAWCARLYALLLVQQRLGQGAAAQRGLAQLLARAALQLCQQLQQQLPLAPHSPIQPHALCLLVLARYAQTQQAEAFDALMPLLAQLAQLGKSRHSEALQPIARLDPAAAWHMVAMAAYADCLETGPSARDPGEPDTARHTRDAAATGLASLDLAQLEAMTRQWLQWHLLAHGGVAAPLPDWTVIAVAELALRPRLAGARRHLQSCSWLAALRQPLQTSLPQRMRPETAMFLPPDHRRHSAFMAPFVLANAEQADSWRIYQWIQSIFVPQLLDF